MAEVSNGVVSVPFATLRNYAELGRISNLPTCWTNVFVGCSIGAASGGQMSAFPMLTVMFAISCFYVAGMAMNDLFDVGIDQIERPERPIPSGRISKRSANLFAGSSLLLGLLPLGTFGPSCAAFAVALAGVILAYNWLHKKFAWTVVLMGACRGLVYLVSAASVTWPVNPELALWLSGSITLYTIVITLIARRENESDLGKRKLLALGMLIIVLNPLYLTLPFAWVWVIPLGLFFVTWNLRAAKAVSETPPRTKEAVLTWLSGMCIVDSFFLSLLGRHGLSVMALAAFVLTHQAHKRIMGT